MNPTDKKVKQKQKATQQQPFQKPDKTKLNLPLQQKADDSSDKPKQGQGGRTNSLTAVSATQQPLPLSRQGSSQNPNIQIQSAGNQPAQPPPQQPNQQPSQGFQSKPKPKPERKQLYDSDSDDDFYGSIPIKKKQIEEEKQPILQAQVKLDEIKSSNTIVIPVAPLNINKCFQEILMQAQKDLTSLTMVRNILSSGSKQLADKQNIFKKKWTQLRNSNVSHQDYLKWEEQIKRNEAFDMKDIKETTIQKLINSKIKGFVSKEQLFEKGKKEYLSRNKIDEDDPLIASKEFKLDEKQYEEFRNDQFTLLEKLMKENNLVAIDMMKPDMMKQARELSNSVLNNPLSMDDPFNEDLMFLDHASKIEAEKQLEFLDDEENNVQKISLCKYFDTKIKLDSNAQSNMPQQNQQQNQGENTGSKLFTTSNNINNNVDPFEIEKNIEKYSFQKIFKNYDDFIRLQSSDNCLIAKRVKSLLLDIKSDELFTDAKFQKEQFEKYQKLLKQINDIESFDLNKVNEDIIKQLVEIAAYIMNNVHYFQKFNLKCDLLHPLDLLYVTEKFLKSSTQSQPSTVTTSAVTTPQIQPTASIQSKKN